MDDFLRISAIWLHILGIALFVGPQFFLAFAWVPAARGIGDMPTRIAATRNLARGFSRIGGIGLLLIIVAGSYLIADWRDYYSIPDETGFTDIRYGGIFISKMVVFLLMLVVVGYHMAVAGPRLIDAMEAESMGNGTAADVRRARVLSMAFSITGLVLALVIMAMGVMMNTTSFSLEQS
ncbi:MAG: hypothetical protein ACR2HN_02585 [Tepidiformaceae bacterium]